MKRQRGENTVAMRSEGKLSQEQLPYDAMGPHSLHRRARVVYRAPAPLVRAYLPLSSKWFSESAEGAPASSSSDSDLVLFGDVGLGLATDGRTGEPVVSVEAAALHELLEGEGEGRASSSPPLLPEWMRSMEREWVSGQCLFACSARTGWRGCYAEHRLWSALLLDEGEGASLRTPYAKPSVRAWFPRAVLDDLRECVHRDAAVRLAQVVRKHGFHGAPDLFLYHPNGRRCWFVEVKSATDTLSGAQLVMLRALRSAGARCDVMCPQQARAKMSDVMWQLDASTDDGEDDDGEDDDGDDDS